MVKKSCQAANRVRDGDNGAEITKGGIAYAVSDGDDGHGFEARVLFAVTLDEASGVLIGLLRPTKCPHTRANPPRQITVVAIRTR